MKIKCNECKTVFYERELAYTPEEMEDCCPVCGSKDVEKFSCKLCGEDMDCEGNICSFCKDEIASAVNGLIETLADRYDISGLTMANLVKGVLNEEV